MIKAVGWEIVTEETVIGFPIPYEQELLSPILGGHVWRMIQWVFCLPPLGLGIEFGSS